MTIRPAGTVSPVVLLLLLAPTIAVGWKYWQMYPGDLFAPNHQLVVRDYLNIWAGGQLAAAGRLNVVFDPLAYAHWLQSIFGTRLDQHSWGYPPHFLLLAMPFAQLPLVIGFFCWAGVTTAFFWIVLRAGGVPPLYAAAAVVSPAFIENALLGQNGALITASLAGGLLLARQQPVIAAALMGLLTIKPQLGILVPVVLLAGRDWRTLVLTPAFGLLYCGIGVVVFGWDAWRDYFTVTAPYMRNYIDAPFGLAAHYMMVPPFMTARAFGASVPVAYGIQAVASLACVALIWQACARRHADRRLVIALVLCLAPLATPYAHSYDLVSVAVACVILAQVAHERDGLCAWERTVLGMAWVWPGSAFLIGTILCPGLGALVVALAAWVVIRHLD